jgi:hypothetical protein
VYAGEGELSRLAKGLRMRLKRGCLLSRLPGLRPPFLGTPNRGWLSTSVPAYGLSRYRPRAITYS